MGKKKVTVNVKPKEPVVVQETKVSTELNETQAQDTEKVEQEVINTDIEQTDESSDESNDGDHDEQKAPEPEKIEPVKEELKKEEPKEPTGFVRALGAANIKTILNCTAQSAKDIDEAYSRLYIVITNHLGLCTEDKFAENLNEIFAFINENPKPFTPLYAMRGIPKITMLSNAQLAELEITLRILIDTAPKTTRVMRSKAMSWPRITELYTPVNAKRIIPRFKAYFDL